MHLWFKSSSPLGGESRPFLFAVLYLFCSKICAFSHPEIPYLSVTGRHCRQCPGKIPGRSGSYTVGSQTRAGRLYPTLMPAGRLP